jgi:hypothetical protein
MKLALILAALSMTAVSQAEDAKKPKAPHCKAIVEVCKKAGFTGGDWKKGDGLYVHCVHPILGLPGSTKTPALKTGLTVPTVAAADVQACQSENPNFGKNEKKMKK